ncbi:MAG: NAD(P)H-hydrate dehydratase [Butyrivibrio sp.]|nr:NAD(P)H-hydrate dehydratase [Butyrivibrio sp.]
MQYAVNADEMKRYDRNTIEFFGMPQAVLMERAALSCTDYVEKWCLDKNIKKPRALVLAGCGNNGGDGVAIGRILKQHGFTVSLSIIGDYTKCTDALLNQLKIAGKYGIPQRPFLKIKEERDVRDFDVIVDAMLGIGCTRPVTGTYAEAIDFIADCKKAKDEDLLVLSVDMPTGINTRDGSICQKAVKADVTITFDFMKTGLIMYPGAEYAGEVLIRDVGITADSMLDKKPGAFFYDEPATTLLPKRDSDGNKGSFGKILIIAGSDKISGACLLSAEAALRSGAGMVKIFTPIQNSEVLRTKLPEAMLECYEYSDDPDNLKIISDTLKSAFEWATCVVMGPGLGLGDTAYHIVKEVLGQCDKKLIIDADALTLIAESEKLQRLVRDYRGKYIIMTPHLGEFARLSGKKVSECKNNILTMPKEMADKFGCTIICKDARSIVADCGQSRIYINVSGNSGMATAGSGDILAGILAAVSAYDLGGFKTASIGAYIHGLAGDLAKNELGEYSMIAGDLLPALPKIFQQ